MIRRLWLILLCFAPVWASATISVGPTLRAPSATGFTVWLKTSATATAVLETSPAGTNTWTTRDTQTTDSSLYDTVLLTATSLTAGTKYDYRIKIDGVVSATYSTWTMPAATGGRFIAYVVADTHNLNASPYASILAHYKSNYEALSIPAVVLDLGDFFMYSPDVFTTETAREFADETFVEIAEAGECLHYLPWLYQFDDWNWLGNNSSSTRFPVNGDIANGDTLHQILWRQPGGKVAGTSWAYQVVIGGVPFIFTDGRSQRTQVGITPFEAGKNGSEAVSGSYTVFGATQRAWLVARMLEYRTKGAIFLMGGGTWRDNQFARTPASTAPTRDSVGLFFKAERNEVISGLNSGGFPAGLNTILLTGDDHRNTVWTEDFKSTPFSVEAAPSGGDLGETVAEVKVISGISAEVGGSTAWFGSGNLFDDITANKASVLAIDVTSSASGATVDARITYLLLGTMTKWLDGSSRVGDFRLNGGTFAAY